jgi:hypothetical protein
MSSPVDGVDEFGLFAGAGNPLAGDVAAVYHGKRKPDGWKHRKL